METTARYLAPGRFTRRVANPTLAGLTRVGLSIKGARILAVRGRRSGEWRTTPVNPLDLDGRQYLVAPRGHTHWVRNLRAAGEGELRLGRRRVPFRAAELTDDEKPPVLRAYLATWKAEVGVFFEGLDEHATDEQLRAAAPDFPAFRLARGGQG